MTTAVEEASNKFNDGADFWRNNFGAQTIPYDTANIFKNPEGGQPLMKWSKPLEGQTLGFKDRPLSNEEFDDLKKNNKFKYGIAIMAGQIWHREKCKNYFIYVIDIDSVRAMKAFLTTEDGRHLSLEIFAKDFVIEQHEDNLCKAHLYGYSTKQLKSMSKGGLEVLTESNHLVNVSPSIHENGYPYVRRGAALPNVPLTDTAIEKHLDNVFKRLGFSYLDGNTSKKAPVSRLDKPKITEGNRHNELRDLINSLISKTHNVFDKELIRKWVYDMNENECEKPYDHTELDRLFESCWEYILKNKEREKENKTPSWLVNKKVIDELSQHHYSIACHNPPKFIVAHRELNQIVNMAIGETNIVVTDDNGKIVWEGEGEPERRKVDILNVRNPIINAIPVSVKKFDDGIHLEYQYSIRFNTNMQKKTFTTQTGTIEDIVMELKSKGMVLSREPDEALTHILKAMEDAGNVTTSKSVQKRGFWLIDDKLDSYDVKIRKPSDKEVSECITLLEDLYSKFKVKSAFPTIIKWGIVSPFSFVMKSYDNWLNWIHSHGFTNCGKTFGGILVLAMWRLSEEHNISFESISSIARFGERLSQTTFPLIINEAGSLNDDKHKEIVETIKNAIEGRTARSKFRGNRYTNIDALRSCMITANPAPPNDAAYKRKCHVITYGVKDRYEKKEIDAFNQWFRPKKQELGALGDFTADYIMKNPELLKKPWDEIGNKVLTELYASIDKEPPEWIYDQINHIEIADSIDDARLNLRAILTEMINEGFSRYSNRNKEQKSSSKYQEYQLINRLDACCEQHLIPSIEKHKDCYVITQTIMHKLREDKCDGYAGGTLKGFAEVLDFEYGSKKVGGKPAWVAYCKFGVMQDLLSGYCPETKR